MKIVETENQNEFYVEKDGKNLGLFVTKAGKSDIPAMVERMENPPAKTISYIEARRAEYPPVGDQLDAIMKWLATEKEITIPAELKSIAMSCMSVKSKHPKAEG